MPDQMEDEVEVAEEAAAQPTGEKTVQDLLDDMGGPSSEQIEKWKAEYGEVFVSAFDPKSVWLWRALRRDEYRRLQMTLTNPDSKWDQFDYEEAVCKQCVLWPATTSATFSLGKGGTATTLAEQVMQNSDFFNPAQAAALVMKL